MVREMDANRLADDVQIRVERGYKLSAPTYAIELISADYAWVQITRPIRECGEICGVPTESEYDECCYEVQVSEDGVNWKGADLDIEELTPNTFYQVRVRTVDLPHHRCTSSNWVTKTFTTLLAEAIQITATSPIQLYFAAGGDTPKLIPLTVSAGIRGEASQLLKGMTEVDILEYYHVDTLEEKVYETVSGGYNITATWNLGQGTVHFELTPVAQTVNITAASSIPLYYSDDSNGPQLIPCSSSVVWDQDNQICDARYTIEDCWDGTHVISSLTFPRGAGIVTKNLSEGAMYDNRYSGSVTADHELNTLHIDITQYLEVEPPETIQITASSPIPVYFSAGGDAPKLIPHTVSAGILGEASQLLKGTTEADILEYYHVDTLEEKVYETVSDGYNITATWNLGGGTVHFELKHVAQLTVDIPASIAAGGIPSTIMTLNDAPFTFIVRNNSNRLVALAVFLSFKGVGTGTEYPRDITGMVTEPEGGMSPPGSDAYVWDDGYVGRALLYLRPNTSGSYTLKVWLPEEAVPAGQEFANYTIHTILKSYLVI